MAYQQSGSIVKTPQIDHTFVTPIKFKFANAAAGTVTVLAGAEIVNTITSTTNTNNCVITVTLNCSLPDVEYATSEYRDDGQAGFWCSTGNITGEATSNACTFKVAVWAAGGTQVTTNNVNANAAVIACELIFRNQSIGKGD